jgi:hypothetical protein
MTPFELKLIITGISLICIGDANGSCPGIGTGEASVLFVDATEDAVACSRPYCTVQGIEGCDPAYGIECVGGGAVCPSTATLGCAGYFDAYLACEFQGLELPPCGGGPFRCVKPLPNRTCRALDSAELDTHHPTLLIPWEHVKALHDLRYQLLPEPDGTSLVLIDLTQQPVEKRCLQLDVDPSTGVAPSGRKLVPGEREPKTASGPPSVLFDWVPQIAELSRGLGTLTPPVARMGADLAKGLVGARLNLDSGILEAGTFRFHSDASMPPPDNYHHYRSCPDRRQVVNGVPLFPRAIPETVVLTDRVQSAALKTCGGARAVEFKADSGPVELVVGNLPHGLTEHAAHGGKFHGHFRWYYELFEIGADVLTEPLPRPFLPEAGKDPDPLNQKCETTVAGGSMLCPSSTYP